MTTTRPATTGRRSTSVGIGLAGSRTEKNISELTQIKARIIDGTIITLDCDGLPALAGARERWRKGAQR